MTQREANYYSHFFLDPALLSAREHKNTTVQFRTLNFHLPREFRFRAASCSKLGTRRDYRRIVVSTLTKLMGAHNFLVRNI